jgi:hypothetical protein
LIDVVLEMLSLRIPTVVGPAELRQEFAAVSTCACRSVVVQRCYFAIQQWPILDSRAHAGGMMHEEFRSRPQHR